MRPVLSLNQVLREYHHEVAPEPAEASMFDLVEEDAALADELAAKEKERRDRWEASYWADVERDFWDEMDAESDRDETPQGSCYDDEDWGSLSEV